MKKKQIAGLALALVMAAGGLAGCAPAEESGETSQELSQTEGAGETGQAGEETIELTFYYPIGVGGALATLIENLATEFTRENPNIVLNPVFAGDSPSTMTKTVSAVQGGTPPDFAILANNELYSLLDMDAIIPLDDMVAEDGGQEYIDDFMPAFLENSYYDGKLYSIPFQRSTVIMYYNKDQFREVGLDPEKPPTSWEELREYAKKLTVTDESGNITRYGVMIPTDAFTFCALSRQNGQGDSQLMSADGTEVYFDTPGNIGVLDYLLELSKTDKVTPEGAIKLTDCPSNFIAGAASIIYGSSGNLTNILDNVDFEVGTAYLPAGTQYGSVLGGANIYVFNGIEKEKQEAAWKFIRWLTEPERVAQWSIDTGYVATRESAYETDLMQDYLAQVPQAIVARDQIEYGSSELCTHDGQRLIRTLEQAIDAAVTGASTPEDAFKQAQEEADAVLSAYK